MHIVPLLLCTDCHHSLSYRHIPGPPQIRGFLREHIIRLGSTPLRDIHSSERAGAMRTTRGSWGFVRDKGTFGRQRVRPRGLRTGQASLCSQIQLCPDRIWKSIGRHIQLQTLYPHLLYLLVVLHPYPNEFPRVCEHCLGCLPVVSMCLCYCQSSRYVLKA